MNKMFRILEIAWFVIGCVGVILSAYFIIIHDNQGSLFFLIFTLVAGIIFSIRRRQRKLYEAAEKRNEKGR